MVTSVRTKQRQKEYWWHGTESAIGVLRMEMGIIWNNRRGDGQKACVAGGIWWDLLNRTRWPRSGKEEIECGRGQSDADLLGAISSGHVGDDHPAPSCTEETLDRDCIAGHPVGLTRITPYVLFSVYLLSPRIVCEVHWWCWSLPFWDWVLEPRMSTKRHFYYRAVKSPYCTVGIFKTCEFGKCSLWDDMNYRRKYCLDFQSPWDKGFNIVTEMPSVFFKRME